MMTLTPTNIRSGNTVTAQYNTAPTNEQPKQLTSKQEQVLKNLESALPFFDASDYGVKAEKGKADKPPVTNEGGKGGNAVKEFFKGIGKAIMSGFEKIGDFFSKHFGKTEAPTRYGDSRVPLPDINTPNLNKGGGQIAYAFTTGGQEGLKKMIGDLAQKLNSDMVQANYPGTIPEYIEEKFSYTSDVGYGLLGQTLADVKSVIPDLKIIFAANPMANGLLDSLNAFDFNASLAKDFTEQVDGLDSPNNPLGSFLRSNNSVSLGLVALAKSEGFDQNAVANQILTPHMKEMADLQKSLGKLPEHERRKEVLTGDNATKMMDLTKSILMDSLKTEGPGSLTEMFGKAHIERLNEMANEIAQREDLPKDVRNKAIETIYVDQLFLRGTMTAMTNTVKSGSVEFTAVQLAQSIVNGAKGDKFTSEDMRNAYTNVATDFRQNFVNAMIDLGMPVVQ
jgi:hypothetical protein